MNTVSSLLTRKARISITISPDASVMEALNLMAEKNIGAVIVMQGEKFLGIITERDYSRKVALQGKNSATTKVAEIMSTNLPFAKPNDTIDYCMEMMTAQNVRYMPVFENNKLTGIVSMSDVVKETILAQKETINHLQSYIQS